MNEAEVIENADEEETTQDQEEEEQEDTSPEDLKALLAKEKAEKEKRKGRFKSQAAKKDASKDSDVNAIVEAKLEQAKVSDKVEHVKNQIPEEYKEAFEAEFAELCEGKTVTTANVDKLVKAALSIALPKEQGDIEQVKAIATGWSVAWGASNWGDKKKYTSHVEAWMQILRDQGII